MILILSVGFAFLLLVLGAGLRYLVVFLKRFEQSLGSNLERTLSSSLTTTLSTTLRDLRMELFNQLAKMMDSNEQKLETLRKTLEERLQSIQKQSEIKLDQMRATVEEKLQGTLEKRLGESFKIVSERLEMVHKGLGEMSSLAIGVGDLKKVLSNVKTRGTWGEIQLGNLLEQVLAPSQFAKNVMTRPSSRDVVEFAICLPGKQNDHLKPVYLPIDAKFPRESYDRLILAQEQGDPIGQEVALKELEDRIKQSAKEISEKYLEPPFTTDFGILYLPTEGLYAEVLRRPGIVEFIQQKYRINITGPTTLGALLNSLQLGFRTLAIEERSSEVRRILGSVKGEFGKFTEILEKVQKKLKEAENTIEDATRKTRTIERSLRDVEETPLPVIGFDPLANKS